MSHPLMIGMLSTNAVVRPESPEPQLSPIGGHAGFGQRERGPALDSNQRGGVGLQVCQGLSVRMLPGA
jgi:hypothetical protein